MMTVQALQLLLEFAPKLLQLQCSLLAHDSLSRAKRVVACQFTLISKFLLSTQLPFW